MWIIAVSLLICSIILTWLWLRFKKIKGEATTPGLSGFAIKKIVTNQINNNMSNATDNTTLTTAELKLANDFGGALKQVSNLVGKPAFMDAVINGAAVVADGPAPNVLELIDTGATINQDIAAIVDVNKTPNADKYVAWSNVIKNIADDLKTGSGSVWGYIKAILALFKL